MGPLRRSLQSEHEILPLIVAGRVLSVSAAALRRQAPADVEELRGLRARYEQEYPVIGYSRKATRNCLARLQEKLDREELQLDFDPQWGYLPSLLQALDIDVDSQVMVFSKTSLQFEQIAADTPRAIYFNDDCYVAMCRTARCSSSSRSMRNSASCSTVSTTSSTCRRDSTARADAASPVTTPTR